MLKYGVIQELHMNKSKSCIFLVVIIFLLCNIFLVSALTGAIGNSKMVLYPDVNGITSTKITKSILIKNNNPVPVNITLKLDDNSTKFITLAEESFIMQPNTEKKAEFVVSVKKEGTYDGKIAVFFKSAEEGSKEPGVALSANIVVIAKKDNGYTDTGSDEPDATEQNSTSVGNILKDLFKDDKDVKENESPINGKNIIIFSSLILTLILIIFLVILIKRGKKKRGKLNGRRK